MELQLEHVCRQYGERRAVDDVSVRLTPGVYGLLGANGAGKTTLMRMICGVLNPTSGRIEADGRPVRALGEAYRTRLGYMPQGFGFYPDFTGREFMRYMAAVKGVPSGQAQAQTARLLRMVNLEEAADRRIRTYSGGMKQRLGIAQAELNDPALLILDEPTAGLDPKERVRLRNLIADLAREKIVILSTHIVSDVAYIADTILMMKRGRILLQGPAASVTESIRGKVWELAAGEREAEDYARRLSVVSLHHEEGRVRLRIVSDARPAPEARPVEPGLEDLFLYHFGDDARGAGEGDAC